MTKTKTVAYAVAALAVASTAMMSTIATAEAKPIKETTIKSECKDAGGTYSSGTLAGDRLSYCRYRDNEGNPHVDGYINGEYTGTVAF